MSLTNPSIGEFVDRLSILRLKIAVGEAKGHAIDHFVRERKEICDRLQDRVNLNDPLIEELFFVNEALWELTDAMRQAVTHGPDVLVAKYGRMILDRNDKRASLIAEISAAHGDHRLEKM